MIRPPDQSSGTASVPKRTMTTWFPQEGKKMSVFTTIKPKEATHIPEPPIAKFLFADTRMAWVWLIVRLYVGYEWLTAGLEKLTGYSFTFDASFGQIVGKPW